MRELDALVDRWSREGARAVALVGSHARGTAGSESDVDVVVVGEGPQHELQVYEGLLVSVAWAPEEEQRARFSEPHYLATHVPGWREARILSDPEGVAAALVAEAQRWSWELVAERCDAWAADRVASFAEEVLKLVAAVGRGHDTLAAAERSILAIHLALPVALRRRILFASENELWDRVAEAVGDDWRDAQNAALAVGEYDVATSARGALRLYELAVREVDAVLDESQHAAVDLALGPLEGQTRRV